MAKVKFDIKKLFATYLSANISFCIEIDGVERMVTGLEAHPILHKFLDDFMNSNGSNYVMEDGRFAKITLVDYDVDPEIETYLDYYEGDEEEETA
jgi:hypothetical protein